jgi:hypothetical protein
MPELMFDWFVFIPERIPLATKMPHTWLVTEGNVEYF